MPCNRHVSFRLVWRWTRKAADDPNNEPSASVSADPINGNTPLVVTLDGSGSSDPDGDPLTYAWSFGDGQAGAGAVVSHTYEQSGSFDATLTVDDGRSGTASDPHRGRKCGERPSYCVGFGQHDRRHSTLDRDVRRKRLFGSRRRPHRLLIGFRGWPTRLRGERQPYLRIRRQLYRASAGTPYRSGFWSRYCCISPSVGSASAAKSLDRNSILCASRRRITVSFWSRPIAIASR